MVKQKASEILLQFLPLKEIQEEMVNHNRLLAQGMVAEGIVQQEPTADPVQVTLVPVELELLGLIMLHYTQVVVEVVLIQQDLQTLVETVDPAEVVPEQAHLLLKEPMEQQI